MNRNRKKRTFLFLFLLFSTLTARLAALDETPRLLNRVLVNINKGHYTQRDMEIYFLVKRILQNKLQNFSIGPDNWLTLLEEYTSDFVIYQSAREIAFYGRQDEVEANLENFLERTKELESLFDIIPKSFESLNPSPEELHKALVNYQIIQNYLLRKNTMGNSETPLGEKPEWLITLEKESHVRIYKEAYYYKKITSIPSDN